MKIRIIPDFCVTPYGLSAWLSRDKKSIALQLRIPLPLLVYEYCCYNNRPMWQIVNLQLSTQHGVFTYTTPLTEQPKLL